MSALQRAPPLLAAGRAHAHCQQAVFQAIVPCPSGATGIGHLQPSVLGAKVSTNATCPSRRRPLPPSAAASGLPADPDLTVDSLKNLARMFAP